MPEKNNWRDDAVTERQIDFLTQHGREIPETKGEASDIITEIMRGIDPATDGQKRRLEFYGIEGSFSKKEASAIIEKNKPLHDEEEYQSWKKVMSESDSKKSGCSQGCGCLVLIGAAFVLWKFFSLLQ